MFQINLKNLVTFSCLAVISYLQSLKEAKTKLSSSEKAISILHYVLFWTTERKQLPF